MAATSRAIELLTDALDTLRDDPGPQQMEQARARIQSAADAIPRPPEREWTAIEKHQINALTRCMRTVQFHSHTDPNRWQQLREQRARKKLRNAAIRVTTPEVLDEAQVRYWRNRLLVEAIVQHKDVEEVKRVTDQLAQIKTLEDLRRLGITVIPEKSPSSASIVGERA